MTTPHDAAATALLADYARLEREALATGTESQRERFARGMLPEAELTALARPQIYQPLADFKRWPMIRATHARHAAGCAVPEMTPGIQTEMVKFDCREGAQLDHGEFEILREIESGAALMRSHPWVLASSAVTVQVYSHSARCTVCAGPVVTKHSAIVRVTWAGRTLAREYAL
jgi:hypothetical protein